MASPEIIDLAKLLAPIEGESPAGNDIRQDSSPTSNYHTIKTARSAARAAERSSVHDGDTSDADEHWRKIISLAPEILTKQSKDLEIASWFTEALIRRHGFHGLRDAFHLIEGLIENYWDNLYPMPDEDGLETRTAPLSGLNGEGAEGVLIAPIRKVPITEGQDPGPFSFWQYQQALDIQRSASEDARNSKADKLGFTLEDIEKAVNDSSEAFYADLLDDITEAIATYRKINHMLEERCGMDEAPPTRNIINILEECRGAISHIGKHKLPIATEETLSAEPSDNGTSQTGSPAPVAVQVGAINSRETAFKQLLDIAQFFRKTEPHSPVSYVLEKAVKWGNMPLNELIVELIPDSSSRERYSELTGVKSNED